MAPKPVPQASVQGSFTFVKHDPKQAKPDRKAINAHALTTWHRRRRQDEIQSFRAKKGAPTNESSSLKQVSATALSSSESSGDSLSTQEADRRKSDLALQISRHPPAPVTILQKGNSDPFDSFPVEFNPAVSQVLKFSLDVLVPILFSSELRFDPSPLAIAKTRQSILHQLHDKCSANAHLSYSVMAMAGMGGTLQANAAMMNFALTCRSKTLNSLQERLATRTQVHDSRTLQVIFLLFASALAERNLKTASMHGNILMGLVRSGSGFRRLDPLFKEHVLTTDVGISANALARPMFNVDEWYPEPAASMEREALLLPIKDKLLDRLRQPLDVSILGKVLRKAFMDLRELVETENILFSKDVAPSYALFRWLAALKLACQSRILHHHANLTAPASISRDAGEQSWMEDCSGRLAQACACAAAIYWSFLMSIDYTSHTVFLANLRKSIESWSLDPTSRNLHPALRLWALYVGATGEHIHHPTAPEKEWHNEQFAVQAMTMGLSCWSDIKSVLRRFLFAERMKPSGEMWCESTLGRYQDKMFSVWYEQWE